MELSCLDLFSGIGGFALGFESVGINTKQFVEVDPTCRKVLQKHWPTVPIHDDVSTYCGEEGAYDIICGGFPCQDISVAGTLKGLSGSRSGLWSEYIRIIREVKPKYVVIENSSNLRNMGLHTILEDLWKSGYDAEWYILEAGQFGASHVRERIIIVAYPIGKRRKRLVKDEYLKEVGQRGLCSEEDLHPVYENVFERSSSWPQPLIRRGDDGTEGRSHRLKQVGNSVYVPLAKFIGSCIVKDSKLGPD